MPSYQHNSSNELTSSSLGSYTYDANGNTLTDSEGRSFMWDFENRIVQAVVPDADTVTLKYDPFGRRIQKSGPATTTNYLYDGNNPLEEVDNSGNLLSRYNQTTRIDEELSEVRAGTTSYYQADGPGSVTSLSNASGVLANTYTYNSFGNLNASSGTLTNPFRFTGREFDSETGLYFYRARYVDSSTGRFISEDPLGFKGGVNFYVFVLNNPVNLRDPLGLKACENCTNAAPLPANSPKCDSYGSETYFGTSLKCFCKCAGDSAWSEQVRGCLACEHDRGTNPFVAHQRCYRAAGLRAHRGALSASVTKNVWLSPSGQVFRT